MKIIQAKAEILYPNVKDPEAVNEMYRRIEAAGRTCYKSEDKITPESARKFVTGLIKRGHEAMIEHASMTVRFTVDRGVSHEIVRHRIASFAQESTRYCVAGDTELTFKNPHVHMTVSELHKNILSSHNGAWKKLNIRQYNNDSGELQFAKVKNVFSNGIRDCLKVTTKLGYNLTCTSDHEILTPNGYKKLQELSVGDSIYVNGTNALYMNYDWLYNQNITLNKTFVQIAEEFGFNVSTVKKWARKLCIPKKGTGYFNVGHTPWNKGVIDERQANALKKYHHCGRRKDNILKKNTRCYQKYINSECAVCGTNENLEVHHIDSNHDNNNPDNLITVCESCHQRVHSKNLLVAYADEIVNIEEVGDQEVYDIEMNSDYHNFVANGIVVHNCNYGKEKFGDEITVVKPWIVDLQNTEDAPEWLDVFIDEWMDTMQQCEKSYMKMVKAGTPPEWARAVLPNSLKTEIVVTATIREWRHIFKLRAAGTTGKPHPQMTEVMIPLLKQCVEAMPELFGDIPALPLSVSR